MLELELIETSHYLNNRMFSSTMNTPNSRNLGRIRRNGTIFLTTLVVPMVIFVATSPFPAYRLKDSIIKKATFNQPILVLEYPYEGWQPAIHSDDNEECQSWRACFIENHNCTSKCRDSLLDLGFTPNPDLSDEENNQNAQKVLWVPDVTVLRRMLKNGVDSNGNP